MALKRLWVTGLNGFAGSHLSQMMRDGHYANQYRLTEPVTQLELKDEASIKAAVLEAKPDCVIHLAARVFVPLANKYPIDAYEINFLGTQRLLAALHESGFTGRFLYVSSGDVYGSVPLTELPVSEERAVLPRNHYGVSKAAAELLCRQWALTGMDVVIARPFNHVGAGQSESFALSDWAKQIIELKHQKRTLPVSVGNLDVTRDFCDVHDVIRAYFMLLDKGVSGEIYNIASGREYVLGDLLNQLFELAGVPKQIAQDQSRVRPNEQTRMCGNIKKLQTQTGWQPVCDMKETLKTILTDWENKLKP
ncbi:MAG: GDP-mannose 4,6-dehydratase [Burkholderiales bacterium]|jgi:GDP-4-dehydro-6-deoxy-D-mannose reductase|nr:GDP-mannose 4,6-dehydratase [Burkholderiales bacterium]